ncbi:FAD-dependent oxidoreductase [Sulfurimonas hongkongensis]|nr:FAD/NAD(P)-binding oxidoreductase [Sulfurimonas hongkongensis]
MDRRKFLALWGLSASALAMSGCKNVQVPQIDKRTTGLPERAKRKGFRVVVVGGGFGGLNTASAIKQNDPNNEIEVLVIEKNPYYFACPMSNTLLSGNPDFKKENFLFTYRKAQLAYGYEVLHAEVNDIDGEKQKVFTNKETISYDYLVLAPGIEYDYRVEFPNWSDAKIARAKIEAPGGLISDAGVEHSILLEQLEEFKEQGAKGEIVIIPQRTKIFSSLEKSLSHKSVVRCAPASYERACMIGDWIKRNNLVGKAKVVVLDSSLSPQAKPAAFAQVFDDLYKGVIEYVGGFDLIDVDFDTKEILYRDIDDDLNYIVLRRKYDILNLIPIQKASSVVEMADIKTNSWGGALIDPRRLTSLSDSRIYVVGDSAVLANSKNVSIPPAAQSAYSLGKEVGAMIANRVIKNKQTELNSFVVGCSSMVSTKPLKLGINIMKEFGFDKNNDMWVRDSLEVNEDGKYYDESGGEGLVGWFEAITGDTFASF